MASTTFPFSTAGIYRSGQWVDVQTLNGRAAMLCRGYFTRFDFVATGTDVTIPASVTATGAVWQVSIDGGGFSSVTMPVSTNTWTTVNVMTGLADSAHTVALRHTSGNIANVAWDAAGFTVTGASPAISAPTGYGPIYTLYGSPQCTSGAWEGNIRANLIGNPALAPNYDNPPLAYCEYEGQFITVVGNPTSLKMFCFNAGQQYRVYVDGTAQSIVTAPSTNQMDWVTLASGLDGASHTLKIGTVTSAVNGYCYALMAVGGTLTTQAATARKPVLVTFGDSITYGVAAGTTGNAANTQDGSNTWGVQLASSKNYECYNRGVSGGWLLSRGIGVGGTPAANIGQGDERFLYTLKVPQNRTTGYVSVVIEIYGVNDIKNTGSFGAASLAEFQAAATTMYNTILDACPTATVYAVGVLPTTASGVTNRTDAVTSPPTLPTNASYNGRKLAAVQAVQSARPSDASRIVYVDPDLWGTSYYSGTTSLSTSTDLADGLHPNIAGNTKIANNLATLIATGSSGTGGGLLRNPGMSGGMC